MKTKWNKARKKTRYIMASNGVLLLVFLALLGAMYLSKDSRLDGLGQREEIAREGQGAAQGAGKNGQGTKEFAQTQGRQPGSSNGEPIGGSVNPQSQEAGNFEESSGNQPPKGAESLPDGQADKWQSSPAAVQGDLETSQGELSGEAVLEGQVQEKIASMSLEEKVAQLFIITPEALTGSPAVTQAGEATREAFGRYPVGGLIFFGENIQSEQQVSEMLEKQQAYSRERIGLPLFLSIDEEGGQVTRVASAPGIEVETFPDISEIGASQDAGQAYRLGEAVGAYLSRMGFNLDFAPVADVLTNPDNTVVKRRSYGSDPQMVAEMVIGNLKGLKQHQVYGCVKHFPGHGATLGDTHEGYSYTDKSWEELKGADTVPFQESISWGVDFVMVGHISLPQVTGNEVPASLSPSVVGGLLREEMGYHGIVLTDALNMEAVAGQYTSSQAAVQAILAGNDMVLMPLDFKGAYQGVLDAVENGTITLERLEESLRRILKVKLGSL